MSETIIGMINNTNIVFFFFLEVAAPFKPSYRFLTILDLTKEYF